jgi:hypothetical protein
MLKNVMLQIPPCSVGFFVTWRRGIKGGVFFSNIDSVSLKIGAVIFMLLPQGTILLYAVNKLFFWKICLNHI